MGCASSLVVFPDSIRCGNAITTVKKDVRADVSQRYPIGGGNTYLFGVIPEPVESYDLTSTAVACVPSLEAVFY